MAPKTGRKGSGGRVARGGVRHWVQTGRVTDAGGGLWRPRGPEGTDGSPAAALGGEGPDSAEYGPASAADLVATVERLAEEVEDGTEALACRARLFTSSVADSHWDEAAHWATRVELTNYALARNIAKLVDIVASVNAFVCTQPLAQSYLTRPTTAEEALARQGLASRAMAIVLDPGSAASQRADRELNRMRYLGTMDTGGQQQPQDADDDDDPLVATGDASGQCG